MVYVYVVTVQLSLLCSASRVVSIYYRPRLIFHLAFAFCHFEFLFLFEDADEVERDATIGTPHK